MGQVDEDGSELGPELDTEERGELEELGEFLSDRALQNLTGSEDLSAVSFLEVRPLFSFRTPAPPFSPSSVPVYSIYQFGEPGLVSAPKLTWCTTHTQHPSAT